MRLRRNPNAIELLTTHPLSVMDYENQRGNWKKLFDTSHPIYVELGTGKGQFLAKASTAYPDINWIGVEKIQEPLLLAAQKGAETENTNVRYLWLDIVKLQEAFAPEEVDRFYLHFSDPWPKARHYKRRLTYRGFLEVYKQLLSPKGDLILKTDSKRLFEFSVDELQETDWTIVEQSNDLHHSSWAETNITTEYEEKFAGMGMPIYYLKAVPCKGNANGKENKLTLWNKSFGKLPPHYQEMVIEYMECLLQKTKRTKETIDNPEK